MMRWVGIDEAGFGPNLGPLVITAVIAEGPKREGPLNLWADLPNTLARAGGPADRLWVDDSKRIHAAGRGFDRLEAATLALLDSIQHDLPTDLATLYQALGAGELADVGLDLWLDSGSPLPPVPQLTSKPRVATTLALRAFEGAPWRIAAIRSIVVSPERFNDGLESLGNKSKVLFATFAQLLDQVCHATDVGMPLSVRSDKHGGRHFYQPLLSSAFPDARVEALTEGPNLSRYTLRLASRRMDLSLLPRADADDGLVALASIVSKYLRECWMSAFNACWLSLLPGLKPTAGYPGDASRFRQAIEPHCQARGLDLRHWWRAR